MPDAPRPFASIVSLNGRLVPARKAVVSVFDRGLLYGDGIFETIRAYQGRLFRFDDHIRRLEQSARAVALRLPHDRRWFHRQVDALLAANRLADALIRLTVTRGVGPPGLEPPRAAHPTVMIVARPFAGYPDALYRRGLRVVIATIRRASPAAAPPHAKHLNYMVNVLAKREATRKRADDAILLGGAGRLCEGTTSNLFFIRAGRLYTPGRATGLLEGITRRVILDLARRLKIPTRQGSFAPRALFDADEAFLSNTSYEIMPVVRVDGQKIGGGRPGPVTRRLHQAFTALR
ncbi:MAG: aminotransferase class IV [Nitrospirota bacterium]